MRFVVVITGFFVVGSVIGASMPSDTPEERAAERLLLAENRTARVPIVVARDATESTRQVAAELA